jgi:hypothetical protein
MEAHAMDLDTLLTAIAAVVAIPAIVVVVRRLVGCGEPLDPAGLFPRPWDLEWPRGIQEEEPVRFRVEAIRRQPRPTEVASERPALRNRTRTVIP